MNILKLSVIMSLYACLSIASPAINCGAYYGLAKVETSNKSDRFSLMDKVLHKINTSPDSHKELLISQVLSDHLQQIHSAYESMITMISSVGTNKKYKSSFEASQLAADKLREVLQDIMKLKEEDGKFKGIVEKYKVCKNNMDVCYVDINDALEGLKKSKTFAEELVISLKNSKEELQSFSRDMMNQEALLEASTAQLFRQSINTKGDIIDRYLTIVNSAIAELTLYEREIVVFLTINYPDLMDMEKQIKITRGLKIEKQPEKKQVMSNKIEVPERLARAIAKRGNSPMGLEVISKIKSGEINITNIFTQMLYYRATYMEKMGKKPFATDNMHSEEPSFFFSIKDITEILQLILVPEIQVENGLLKINFPGIIRERETRNGRVVISSVSLDIRNKNPMGELIDSFGIQVGSEKVTEIISFHNFNIDGIFLLTEGKSSEMYKDFNSWLNSLKQNFLDQVDKKFLEVSQEEMREPKKLSLLDKLSREKRTKDEEERVKYRVYANNLSANWWAKDDAIYVSRNLFNRRSDVSKIELLLLMAENTRDHSLQMSSLINNKGGLAKNKKIELSISKDY